MNASVVLQPAGHVRLAAPPPPGGSQAPTPRLRAATSGGGAGTARELGTHLVPPRRRPPQRPQTCPAAPGASRCSCGCSQPLWRGGRRRGAGVGARRGPGRRTIPARKRCPVVCSKRRVSPPPTHPPAGADLPRRGRRPPPGRGSRGATLGASGVATLLRGGRGTACRGGASGDKREVGGAGAPGKRRARGESGASRDGRQLVSAWGQCPQGHPEVLNGHPRALHAHKAACVPARGGTTSCGAPTNASGASGGRGTARPPPRGVPGAFACVSSAASTTHGPA